MKIVPFMCKLKKFELVEPLNPYDCQRSQTRRSFNVPSLYYGQI